MGGVYLPVYYMSLVGVDEVRCLVGIHRDLY